MTFYLGAYAIATITLFILDFIWLGFVAKGFYSNQLGHLMADNVRYGIAAAFYMTYTVGIVVFAVKPAIEAENIMLALGYGALFGFLAYGTYDFTNMATLKDWPIKMSIVDIIWGTTLSATVAWVTYYVIMKLNTAP